MDEGRWRWEAAVTADCRAAKFASLAALPPESDERGSGCRDEVVVQREGQQRLCGNLLRGRGRRPTRGASVALR
jgi:hypothetical protein